MYVFPHRIIAWILLIVAMVLGVVAASTSMWYKGGVHELKLTQKASLVANLSLGPFRACGKAGLNVPSTSGVVPGGDFAKEKCVSTGSLTTLSAKMQAVRAMTIVSIASSGLAVLLCGLSHAGSNDGQAVRALHNTSVFFGWLAGVSGAVAVGVFASIKHLSSGLKWGYILMCVSTILSFIGAIMITAPAIPATDIAPASPAGETIVAAAVAGATNVPVGQVVADHEAAKAALENANLTKAALAPHSAEGEAAAGDHEAEVHAGVAEPQPHPLK